MSVDRREFLKASAFAAGAASAGLAAAPNADAAKRWGDHNDVRRATRIMMAAGFTGTFALEYETAPLNGIEGAKYLYTEVLAALAEEM